jgi:cobalamin biosynthesis Mg chelatase CobN
MTNRDYLQQALDTENAKLNALLASLTEAGNLFNSLTKQLQAEKNYYLSLTPINVTKKKTSEQKQAMLSNQILAAKKQIDFYTAEIAKQKLVIAEVQQKINAYDSAVNTGLQTGLSETQATQAGNIAIQGEVDAMQARENATTEAASNKNLVKNIIIALIVLIILALIAWLIYRKSKKSSTATA